MFYGNLATALLRLFISEVVCLFLEYGSFISN